jgi:hypothetical protein
MAYLVDRADAQLDHLRWHEIERFRHDRLCDRF